MKLQPVVDQHPAVNGLLVILNRDARLRGDQATSYGVDAEGGLYRTVDGASYLMGTVEASPYGVGWRPSATVAYVDVPPILRTYEVPAT